MPKPKPEPPPAANPDPYARVPKPQRIPPPTMQRVEGAARYMHTFTCPCSVLNLGVESEDELLRPPDCPMCHKPMEPQSVTDRRASNAPR